MKKIIYEARAQILKAMAHPVRLKIIDKLSGGEKCVCELLEFTGFKMPTISRHLSQMKNAGIIKGRRNGNQIYYRLLTPCIVKVFSCIDNVMKLEKKQKFCM